MKRFFVYAAAVLSVMTLADQPARWASLVGGDTFLCLLDIEGVKCRDSAGPLAPDHLPALDTPFRLSAQGDEVCAATAAGTRCWKAGQTQTADRGDLLWQAPKVAVKDEKRSCEAKANGIECQGFVYNAFGKVTVFDVKNAARLSLRENTLCYFADKEWGCGDLSFSTRSGGHTVPFHRATIPQPGHPPDTLLQTRTGHVCTLRHKIVRCAELAWDEKPGVRCLSRGGHDRECTSTAKRLGALDNSEILAPYGDAICGLKSEGRLACWDLAKDKELVIDWPFRNVPFRDLSASGAGATLETLAKDIYRAKAKILEAAAALFKENRSEVSKVFVLNLLRPLFEDVATAEFENEVMPLYRRAVAQGNYPAHRGGLVSFHSEAGCDEAAVKLAVSAVQAAAAERESDNFATLLSALGQALSSGKTDALEIARAFDKARADLGEVRDSPQSAARGAANLALLVADYFKAAAG